SRNSPKETRPSNEHRPASCDNFTCRKEVWAACPTCLCFLCYDHFTLSDKCNNHNSNFSQLTSNTPKFPTANEEETEVSLTTPSDVCCDEVMFPAPSSQPPTPEANFSFIPTIPLIHDVNEVDGEMMSLLLSTGPIPPLFSETEEVTYPVLSTAPINVEPCEANEPPSIAATMPEACENRNVDRLAADYVVDGDPRQFSPKKIKEIKSRNALVKKKRNLGEAYTTEKTNKLMPAKRDAMENSKCTYCEFKELD
ncbi:uncharacterized protein LOC117110965, partial [Anneissia japonica]|uniref:uncharacterized protein LOC117110965 n=1 Tax=Anneissia japonica TaxID=1529436 RepID=UPI00142581C0